MKKRKKNKSSYNYPEVIIVFYLDHGTCPLYKLNRMYHKFTI